MRCNAPDHAGHICHCASWVSARPTPPSHLPDPEDLRAMLAYNIRSRHVALGLSQEQLAFDCGLDRTYVSEVERSVWNVGLTNIEQIATALTTERWRLLKPPAVGAMIGPYDNSSATAP